MTWLLSRIYVHVCVYVDTCTYAYTLSLFLCKSGKHAQTQYMLQKKMYNNIVYIKNNLINTYIKAPWHTFRQTRRFVVALQIYILWYKHAYTQTHTHTHTHRLVSALKDSHGYEVSEKRVRKFLDTIEAGNGASSAENEKGSVSRGLACMHTYVRTAYIHPHSYEHTLMHMHTQSIHNRVCMCAWIFVRIDSDTYASIGSYIQTCIRTCMIHACPILTYKHAYYAAHTHIHTCIHAHPRIIQRCIRKDTRAHARVCIRAQLRTLRDKNQPHLSA